MADDPRELARRLAEQAKAKLKSQDEDPRELARRLAEEAKRRAADNAVAPAPAIDAPPPEKLTAMQALERERERRRQQEAAAPAPAPAASAPTALPPRAPAVDATSASETTSPGGTGAVTRIVQAALPNATVVFQAPITQVEVARALWRSHQARAQQEQDPQLVTTAAVVLDALDRVPAGHLVAARATINGKDWAFWLDTSREALLATAFPAEVYLAGIS